MSETEEHVRRLIERLAEGSWAVRMASALNLGEIGGAAEAALPALVLTLKRDGEWRVRSAAAMAIERIGPVAVLPALVEALGDPEWAVRIRAAWTLGAVGPAAAAAVPALTDALADDEYSVRDAVRDALHAICGE